MQDASVYMLVHWHQLFWMPCVGVCSSLKHQCLALPPLRNLTSILTHDPTQIYTYMQYVQHTDHPAGHNHRLLKKCYMKRKLKKKRKTLITSLPASVQCSYVSKQSRQSSGLQIFLSAKNHIIPPGSEGSRCYWSNPDAKQLHPYLHSSQC